jgi:hypothetical protein
LPSADNGWADRFCARRAPPFQEELPRAVTGVFQNPRVPKWAKFMVAVLLLPGCAATGWTLWQLVGACGGADVVLVPLLAGAGCWIAVYLLLPKPMWLYVFGHELTHALWVWLFGGRVKRFKATANGGHIVADKTNFLIVLAPYFFPLYAALLVGLFVLGTALADWTRYRVWFHLLLGAAYAFHVTLTAHVLKTRQSDITSQGYLFSGVVIFLGNALVLLLGLPLLTGAPPLTEVAMRWLQNLLAFYGSLLRLRT